MLICKTKIHDEGVEWLLRIGKRSATHRFMPTALFLAAGVPPPYFRVRAVTLFLAHASTSSAPKRGGERRTTVIDRPLRGARDVSSGGVTKASTEVAAIHAQTRIDTDDGREDIFMIVNERM